MGLVLITAKIMPESVDSDLESIKSDAKSLLEAEGANNLKFDEVPIAFGLKAIMVQVGLDESKGSEIVETKLSSIAGVSSVSIEDYRRAFG
jgi:translation elongation factor aEF-1 beta